MYLSYVEAADNWFKHTDGHGYIDSTICKVPKYKLMVSKWKIKMLKTKLQTYIYRVKHIFFFIVEFSLKILWKYCFDDILSNDTNKQMLSSHLIGEIVSRIYEIFY